MILLITKMMLAHFIGDFYLQSSGWVQEKEQKKYKSFYLYIHSAIHGLLVWILMWEWSAWKLAIPIALVHFVIDLSKLVLQTEKSKRTWFFIDQILHIISILVIASIYQNGYISIDITQALNSKNIIYVTGYVILTLPMSIMIQKTLLPWSDLIGEADDDSLLNAGQYIGILERSFVFVFVLANRWEAVGFLLAAKSVFRFGDLKESKDRKLTEYILLGTLLSFGIAIVVSMLVIYLEGLSL
ncbi:MAG: DUF3307 domain-containing protein [Saprospiraceae bacterium]|nr:DUF3307 domain-containing protein [Saprospiraceae bacterium]